MPRRDRVVVFVPSIFCSVNFVYIHLCERGRVFGPGGFGGRGLKSLFFHVLNSTHSDTSHMKSKIISIVNVSFIRFVIGVKRHPPQLISCSQSSFGSNALPGAVAELSVALPLPSPPPTPPPADPLPALPATPPADDPLPSADAPPDPAPDAAPDPDPLPLALAGRGSIASPVVLFVELRPVALVALEALVALVALVRFLGGGGSAVGCAGHRPHRKCGSESAGGRESMGGLIEGLIEVGVDKLEARGGEDVDERGRVRACACRRARPSNNKQSL